MEATDSGQALTYRFDIVNDWYTCDGGDEMNTMNYVNTVSDAETVDVINDRSIRDILKAVPGSYDDFVNSTAECMNKDENLRNMILNLLRVSPGADSSDVLKALCDFYGFNKPLELVDDDEEESFPEANTIGLRKVAY